MEMSVPRFFPGGQNIIKSNWFRQNWQIVLLIVLISTGLILQFSGLLDLRMLLQWAKKYSEFSWLPVLLILIQAMMFTFALPGSSMLWIVAPLYQPLTATAFLIIGTTLGALSAYWLAHHTHSPWLQQVKKQHIFSMLKQRSDFFILFILRIFPGLPHSLINYCAGLLQISLISFVITTIIGTGIKTLLYAQAIHTAVNTEALSGQELLGIVIPLLLLVVLSIISRLVWERQRNKMNHTG